MMNFAMEQKEGGFEVVAKRKKFSRIKRKEWRKAEEDMWVCANEKEEQKVIQCQKA